MTRTPDWNRIADLTADILTYRADREEAEQDADDEAQPQAA